MPRERGRGDAADGRRRHRERSFFSPDGATIAFTGEYDGNIDVFTIPSSGGVPKRLTFHPAPDEVVGWSPDGKRILFRSTRDSHSRFPRLYTVSTDGGSPRGSAAGGRPASFSPGGSRLAYVPTFRFQLAWKRYRGGQTTPIWVARLADSEILEKIPRDNSNDFNPMWIGQKIYFLSDRKGPVTLFTYDLQSKKVEQVLKNDGLDLKNACAGPAPSSMSSSARSTSSTWHPARHPRAHPPGGRFPRGPAHEVKAGRARLGAISPTGARAVFQVRGDIVTVPAEKGSIRNLTNTPGVMRALSGVVARWQMDRLFFR